METKKENTNQEIRLVMRENLYISGVVEVVRFDDLSVVLQTVCGELTVDGKDIKISVLDTDKGMVTVDGEIDALYYSDNIKAEKRNFFGRLFA